MTITNWDEWMKKNHIKLKPIQEKDKNKSPEESKSRIKHSSK